MAQQDSYRLPRHTRPSHYQLDIHPDLSAARFTGAASIDLEVLEPTSRLVLNAADLVVPTASLSGPEMGPDSGMEPSIAVDDREQQLLLDFRAQVAPGRYRLHLTFAGVLNDLLRGFYRSTYRDATGAERVIATTQFEATDARRAFPCWDEPDFKATFSLTIVVDPGLTALSNGALESAETGSDGRTTLRFARTMPMSTYLVAFVIGPFELTDPRQVDGVPIRVAAVPGKLSQADFALEVAEHALSFLSRYFGIPYPGGKIDHVAVPDFAFGAMENLGCVTYRESLLLADPASTALVELQRIAAVVAHETAHMWFGDLVTMKWWNGIWLNEAFATFMELTTTDHFRPDWNVWATFGAGKTAAMETDGLRASRPVEYPVGRPEEADGMFDVLTYQKGGAVLKMLEQYLGAEVFQKGIAHYLSSHAYGNTETADLWRALEAVSGEPVSSIMESWIHQEGHPVIEADLEDDGATVVLRQSRFLYDGSTGPGRWSVPVNLRASVAGAVQHERFLLDQTEGSFTFAGPVDWVVVNDGAWGFYRTRYSDPLWGRLAGGLTTLGPIERLQLLSDAWASVAAGATDLSVWAGAARALAGEPDPDVWGSILSSLRMLDLSAEDSERPALRSFASTLAAPVWDALGWDPRPGEDDRATSARGRVLTVLGDLGAASQLIDQAAERMEAHLAHQVPGLSADLVGPAARLWVASGGEPAWSAVLGAYRDSTNLQEQLRYLYALGRTTDAALRARTLDLALSSEVRSQNAPFLLAVVIGTRQGAAQYLDWVEANWAELVRRFPPSLLIRVIEAVTSITDSELAERVRAFLGSRDIPLAPVRVRQALEAMGVSVALASRMRGTIAAALAAGTQTSGGSAPGGG